jgi:hypothetical protein
MGQTLDTLLQQWGTYSQRHGSRRRGYLWHDTGCDWMMIHRILPNLERGTGCSWNGFWRKDMEDENCDGLIYADST